MEAKLSLSMKIFFLALALGVFSATPSQALDVSSMKNRLMGQNGCFSKWEMPISTSIGQNGCFSKWEMPISTSIGQNGC